MKAKHLVSLPGVQVLAVAAVTYVHLMFDQHEIIMGDGVWSESFQPGDRTLSGLDPDQLHELEKIFPDFSGATHSSQYESAHLTLKPHEARVLLAA